MLDSTHSGGADLPLGRLSTTASHSPATSTIHNTEREKREREREKEKREGEDEYDLINN